jgi:hypothetical protein
MDAIQGDLIMQFLDLHAKRVLAVGKDGRDGQLKSWVSANQDFRRARSRATLEEIMARLTGKSAELLCYEDVRQNLGATAPSSRGRQDIPLDAIVGSVGRCADFTRSFLPLKDSDRARWAKVELATTDLRGLPPIEAYQIDQVYFVVDGNHRVSTARQLGAAYIQAYVTEVHTKLPLSPDDQPDDLIVKAEYVEFLDHTHLDEFRPDADMSVSVPGQYRELEEHIAVHRTLMAVEEKREIPHEAAVAHWYDTVYWPVVQIIREKGILRDFPGRTETDLYLWIARHGAELAQRLDGEIRTEAAADDLVKKLSPRPRRVLARVIERIRHAISANLPESGDRCGRSPHALCSPRAATTGC